MPFSRGLAAFSAVPFPVVANTCFPVQEDYVCCPRIHWSRKSSRSSAHSVYQDFEYRRTFFGITPGLVQRVSSSRLCEEESLLFRIVGSSDRTESPAPPSKASVVESLQDISRRIRDLVFKKPEAEEESAFSLYDPYDFDTDEDNSDTTVLLLGATGAVGQIILRKLVLARFKVRALVRQLDGRTRDILGDAVEPFVGDIRDRKTLLEAVHGVQKVICAVGTNEIDDFNAVFNNGVANVVMAFQWDQTRFRKENEATGVNKRMVIEFQKRKPCAFKPVEVKPKAAAARSSSTPQVLTLDQALYSPAKITPPPVPHAEIIETRSAEGRKMVVFSGVVHDTPLYARTERKLDIDLEGFAGFLLRASADGKKYVLSVRTAESEKQGARYECEIETQIHQWSTFRLPFDRFFLVLDEGTKPEKVSLPKRLIDADRESVTEFAVGVGPDQKNTKSRGKFFLELHYIKAFKESSESAFILLSCATVNKLAPAAVKPEPVFASTKRNAPMISEAPPVMDQSEIGDQRTQRRDRFRAARLKGERFLRKSGIPYTIIRPGILTRESAGSQPLVVDQMGRIDGTRNIPVGDVAELCIDALQNSKAVNVTFEVCAVPFGRSSGEADLGILPAAEPGQYADAFAPLTPNT
mmetsp:Transcript_11965/g.19323  ORF Transcript_11965/g.19323 Transcript_11965/m.19323 type:complete len:638 (-) Transcript_11965:20-1933(-)|eukprot:CAMPEP_0184660936 /NCGR_PEP_ID=MMETSP0308-20130426/36169_1 /TAXON_ID=38269 /ORGANISM="Gloeochaete witrockiana, Strain SAG 46.84" /LENGTH=637 /DNA_ID=CAMNT_0027101891 /DNA_START=25 /DNA_END=1938 /DNA_ORIENTATION=+